MTLQASCQREVVLSALGASLPAESSTYTVVPRGAMPPGGPRFGAFMAIRTGGGSGADRAKVVIEGRHRGTDPTGNRVNGTWFVLEAPALESAGPTKDQVQWVEPQVPEEVALVLHLTAGAPTSVTARVVFVANFVFDLVESAAPGALLGA